MPGKPRPRVAAKNVRGLKYFKQLQPLFARLHDLGTQRNDAGNRQLFLDQYAALVLLFFFNPTLCSLRALQQASCLDKVQKKLGCPRTSLGSLSEAARVFDAEAFPVTPPSPRATATKRSNSARPCSRADSTSSIAVMRNTNCFKTSLTPSPASSAASVTTRFTSSSTNVRCP